MQTTIESTEYRQRVQTIYRTVRKNFFPHCNENRCKTIATSRYAVAKRHARGLAGVAPS